VKNINIKIENIFNFEQPAQGIRRRKRSHPKVIRKLPCLISPNESLQQLRERNSTRGSLEREPTETGRSDKENEKQLAGQEIKEKEIQSVPVDLKAAK